MPGEEEEDEGMRNFSSGRARAGGLLKTFLLLVLHKGYIHPISLGGKVNAILKRKNRESVHTKKLMLA